MCVAATSPDGSQVQLRIEALAPSTSYNATPLHALRLLPTALASALQQPAVVARRATGFLTMEQTRKLIILSERDPTARTAPLIGAWVSGVSTLDDPLVYAAVTRFARTVAGTSMDGTGGATGGSFLLLVYSCDAATGSAAAAAEAAAPPRLYEVSMCDFCAAAAAQDHLRLLVAVAQQPMPPPPPDGGVDTVYCALVPTDAGPRLGALLARRRQPRAHALDPATRRSSPARPTRLADRYGPPSAIEDDTAQGAMPVTAKADAAAAAGVAPSSPPPSRPAFSKPSSPEHGLAAAPVAPPPPATAQLPQRLETPQRQLPPPQQQHGRAQQPAAASSPPPTATLPTTDALVDSRAHAPALVALVLQLQSRVAELAAELATQREESARMAQEMEALRRAQTAALLLPPPAVEAQRAHLSRAETLLRSAVSSATAEELAAAMRTERGDEGAERLLSLRLSEEPERGDDDDDDEADTKKGTATELEEMEEDVSFDEMPRIVYEPEDELTDVDDADEETGSLASAGTDSDRFELVFDAEARGE